MSCVKSRCLDSCRPGEPLCTILTRSSPPRRLPSTGPPGQGPARSPAPPQLPSRRAGKAPPRRPPPRLARKTSPAASGRWPGSLRRRRPGACWSAAARRSSGSRRQPRPPMPRSACTVNLRQMDLQGVTSRLADEDGRHILVVEGEIRNLAEAPRAAPRMRLAVLDARGPRNLSLGPRRRRNRGCRRRKGVFRARLAAPPQDGRDVRVRFAGAADGGTRIVIGDRRRFSSTRRPSPPGSRPWRAEIARARAAKPARRADHDRRLRLRRRPVARAASRGARAGSRFPADRQLWRGNQVFRAGGIAARRQGGGRQAATCC